MKIYDIIKPLHSSTNVLYVVADGYVLSELDRIYRSIERQTEGKNIVAET